MGRHPEAACFPEWPGRVDGFLQWYRAAGELRIFWAKPVLDAEVQATTPEGCLLRIIWSLRKKPVEAHLWVLSTPRRLSEPSPVPTLALFPEDAWPDLRVPIRARSLLYLWFPDAPLLEPHPGVQVRHLDTWTDEDLARFRAIHRASWGFFVPPVRGRHRVLLALLDREPVGLAYWNPANGNLDYGVHVVKTHWRQRIGTRLLHEARTLARRAALPAFTVVRVFRSLRQGPGTPPLWGTAADRRAVAFYRANRPSLRFLVVRLAPSTVYT